MVHTEFERQGNFTVALVADQVAERLFVGVTVLGPGDEYNEHIGEAIAEGRAMDARARYYAEYAVAL